MNNTRVDIQKHVLARHVFRLSVSVPAPVFARKYRRSYGLHHPTQQSPHVIRAKAVRSSYEPRTPAAIYRHVAKAWSLHDSTPAYSHTLDMNSSDTPTDIIRSAFILSRLANSWPPPTLCRKFRSSLTSSYLKRSWPLPSLIACVSPLL